eukprot:14403754-Ditylum_brightwellii.AAC.1
MGVVKCDLAHQLLAAVDALDEYMSSVYTAEEHKASFGHSPMLYCDYKTLKKREKGKISRLLETYWGTHAYHPGNAPDDW